MSAAETDAGKCPWCGKGRIFVRLVEGGQTERCSNPKCSFGERFVPLTPAAFADAMAEMAEA